jgi:hypothetical protein
LIARYEFEALEFKKANELSKKLGMEEQYYTPQILAEIFNQHEHNAQQEKKRIGFLA